MNVGLAVGTAVGEYVGGLVTVEYATGTWQVISDVEANMTLQTSVPRVTAAAGWKPRPSIVII